LLEDGYKRLTSYECKNGGYEWFGSEPANEALTAYGTLEFVDMAKVFPVDPAMLKRTKQWLYSRKDGKGGFKLDKQALDDFGAAPQDITNAYIVWSLTEAGEKDLDLEISSIYKDSKTKKDAYLWGLAASSLFTTGKKNEAMELAKSICEHQQKTGEVLQSKTTITCSRGKSLNVETTAIAVLTWMNDEKFSQNVETAMNWLLKQCNNGSFGNTQATVLALKAIVKFDAKRGGSSEGVKVSYKLDGKKVDVDLENGKKEGVIELKINSSLLTPGDHTLSLDLSGKGSLPFSFFVKYFSENPDSSEKCEIDLKNYLSSDTFEEGSTGEMNVEITNLVDEKQAMTLAIISIPGGLEPRHENLQELVKSGKIAFYEIKGRDVVIYLRGMKKKEVLKFKFDVLARIPGKFKSSASRAYLYYVDEDVKWLEGTQCTIVPKK
jgi:alpha-2-macroglobulin-like protein